MQFQVGFTWFLCIPVDHAPRAQLMSLVSYLYKPSNGKKRTQPHIHPFLLLQDGKCCQMTHSLSLDMHYQRHFQLSPAPSSLHLSRDQKNTSSRENVCAALLRVSEASSKDTNHIPNLFTQG